MKNILNLLKNISFVTSLILLSHIALASPLYLNIAASATKGIYVNSQLRSNFVENEVTISNEYLDDGGLLVGYGQTFVGMKDTSFNITQQHRFASGRINFWPDILEGRLTLRLDGHKINNNDFTSDTDGVIIGAPQISWLANDTSLYIDLGYANSKYHNNLNVNQFTSTIGFGFNRNIDWIQLRSYQIRGLNSARASGKSSTSGLDAKWTHYFLTSASFIPSVVTMGAWVGERIYAVDMDSMSVANLADLGIASASLLLSWELRHWANFTVLAGKSRFRDVALVNDYTLNLAYINFTLKW